jgi:RecA-family ATPase
MNAVDTITINTVQSRAVSWLWEPYIPLGTVSVVLGDGGLGKSFLSLAIAAAVTNGALLPGMADALPPSDVIVQNAENPIATVVKPRLELLGADCGKIHIIT